MTSKPVLRLNRWKIIRKRFCVFHTGRRLTKATLGDESHQEQHTCDHCGTWNMMCMKQPSYMPIQACYEYFPKLCTVYRWEKQAPWASWTALNNLVPKWEMRNLEELGGVGTVWWCSVVLMTWEALHEATTPAVCKSGCLAGGKSHEHHSRRKHEPSIVWF